MKKRWLTAQSTEKLSTVLGIKEFVSTQDWELIHADPKRVNEFVTLYERGDLTNDDRFALMALIIASLDDKMSTTGADDGFNERIHHLLVTDFSLHESTIWYWCVWDEPDTQNIFRVTPLMRETWTNKNTER